MLILAPPYPSEKFQKEKQPFISENRIFLDKWEAEYLSTYVNDGPVCIVCEANVEHKEDNVRWHYKTQQKDKHKDLAMTQRHQKVKDDEMKRHYIYY